jgi:hypothetical protein
MRTFLIIIQSRVDNDINLLVVRIYDAGDHCEIILEREKELCMVVKANGPLVYHMFQSSAISFEEKVKCHNAKHAFQCTKRLLRIIRNKPACVYDVFLEGLKLTGQDVAYRLLTSGGMQNKFFHLKFCR